MKKKYIIGISLGLLFVIIAVISFDKSKVDYADFQKAHSTGKVYQIIGSWVQDKPENYDSKKNEFSFFMKDDKGNVSPVIFQGSKPNNFNIAPSVVIKGKFEGGTFIASNLLTKCPSKYEGKDMDEHLKNNKQVN